jgi:hypothetical protein
MIHSTAQCVHKEEKEETESRHETVSTPRQLGRTRESARERVRASDRRWHEFCLESAYTEVTATTSGLCYE